MNFVNLRVHSDFSLSEGASKIDDLIATVKNQGAPAVALTDKNFLFGAMDFSKKAASAGIEPIIGIQMAVHDSVLGEKHIIVLVQSEAGYRNICVLNRLSTLPGHQSAVSIDELLLHNEGLIILTGGIPGGLLYDGVSSDLSYTTSLYRRLLSVFCDRLYVEICRNGHIRRPGQAEKEQKMLALAYGDDIDDIMCADGISRREAPLVATSDVWYATPDRHEAWVLLDAVSRKTMIEFSSDGINDANKPPSHLLDDAEAQKIFSDLPEAVENTIEIAKRCAYCIHGHKPMLPEFPVANGRGEVEELRDQARSGLLDRLQKFVLTDDMETDERLRLIEKYEHRLEYELGVIETMGFPGYFLIVSDFIKWAKSKDIPVGPGRGSGAGSVVAWALMITDLDPLRYNLLFERFLNPDRVSMPDFDVDFCQDRRGEVIQYVREKYGDDHVSMIATFGLIQAKSALKDAGRCIQSAQHGSFHFQYLNEITSLIPLKLYNEDESDDEGSLLLKIYRNAPDFKARIDGDEKSRFLFEKARKIEGLARNFSTHAAGVIIGDRPLYEHVPVTWDSHSNMQVASFNMKGVETSGLVKFDFLGLKTLSVLKKAVDNIYKHQGIAIDITTLPVDDPKVYEFFACGRTVGVFQFEGDGMQRVLRQVAPTRFEDLIAVNALYRPGPMAYIDTYAHRKAGVEQFSYPSPVEKTEKFLSETYGIMVYQEQVMQVAQACAGYSLGGADILRRAIGKKNMDEMERQKDIFIHGSKDGDVPGAVRMGMNENDAVSLFEDIKKFAEYGFNKSHAAAYSWIAYQTMWLKCHYPVEFFAALMSYSDNESKLSVIYDELRDLGIALFAPDINRSFADFAPDVVDNISGVRFGLKAIKQISGSLDEFTSERERNGAFSDIENFFKRCCSMFSKDQITRLSEVGAFSGLCRSRREANDILLKMMTKKTKIGKPQPDFFEQMGASIEIGRRMRAIENADLIDFINQPHAANEWDDFRNRPCVAEEWDNILDREYKALGFYYSAFPTDMIQERLVRSGVRRLKSYISHFRSREETSGIRKDEYQVSLCGLVNDVYMQVSKKGSRYLKVMIEERGDRYRVLIFGSYKMNLGDLFEQLSDASKKRSPVILKCRLRLEDNNGAMITTNQKDVVLDVEDYLKAVRRDVRIEISGDSIRLDVGERKYRDQAEKHLESGDISEFDHRQIGKNLRARVLGRIRDRIVAWLEARKSDDANASEVALVADDQVYCVVNGRYLITSRDQAVLSAIDGVRRVVDVFPEKKSAAAPASTNVDAVDNSAADAIEESDQEFSAITATQRRRRRFMATQSSTASATTPYCP